jgi:hypothetical protein
MGGCSFTSNNGSVSFFAIPPPILGISAKGKHA